MQKLLLITLLLLAGNLSAQEIPSPPPEMELKEKSAKVDEDALEEFGTRVFNMLKGMDTITLNEFIDVFATDEEIEEMIVHSTVPEEKKQAMLDHPQRANLNAYCKRSYESLKGEAASFGLTWSTIELDSITRTALEQNGTQVLYGRFLFWKEDTLLSVGFQAPHVGGKYCLGGLENLEIAGGRGGFGPPPEEIIVDEVPEPELTDIEKYGGVIERDEPPMDQTDSLGEIVDFPDEEAQFPGGTSALLQFINDSIQYPELKAFEHPINTLVFIEFVVEKDGSLSNFVLRKGEKVPFGDEAMRVLRLMPKWIPGKVNGAAVRTRMIVPVQFETF